MKHLSRPLRNDRIRAYEQKYRDKMKVWTNRLKNKHRVKLKGLDGDFSVKQWQDLLKKHDGRCVRCGSTENITIDHVVPLGVFKEWAAVHHPSYRANDIENIQPLCLHCNSSKKSDLEAE
jgi:5-methylcytosine-specific restriction endonuclease McrA